MKIIVEGHSTATNLIFVHDIFGHFDDRKCRFIYHLNGISFIIKFASHISVVLMNYAVHHNIVDMDLVSNAHK